MRRAVLVFLMVISFVHEAYALDTYRIDIDNSRIDGSIHYSVVGKYRAIFEDFSGEIYANPDAEHIKGVKLIIKTDSIKSRFANLDNIVKSQQLLDAQRYPEVIFESFDFQPKEEGEFLAMGHLDLHGVVQRLELPFHFEGPMKDAQGRHFVRVKGSWVINRKDFNIIWNKFLDKGGIFVGNHITVDWEIVAYRN